MLSRLFHTRKIEAVLAIVVIVSLVIGFLLYRNYVEQKKFEEQTVMADEYLKEGNYKQAIEAYTKALSMKYGNEEQLSIDLSEVYIKMNDYNMALEVLRECYSKTSGNKIKEKIEEVTVRKTEFEYNDIITKADKYFNNKEYDKAIVEYEKAKLIKSKEVLSYKRIAEAYIAKKEYKSAKKEVVAGIAITDSKELNDTLDKVNVYLMEVEYNDMLNSASEYIYQENFEDGIAEYKEAIELKPNDEKAYIGLSQAYITIGKYDSAVSLLEEALKGIKSEELQSVLDKARMLKEEKDERKRILADLYSALVQLDITQVKSLMAQPFFKEKIAKDSPVYYSPGGEGDKSMGYGMIIYSKNRVYCGGLKDGIKKGMGVYFRLTYNEEGSGYHYYQGEWVNDIPHGIGKSGEMQKQTEGKEEYTVLVITDGFFYNGKENGSMTKYYYKDGNEAGTVAYFAEKGIPKALLDDLGEKIYKENSQEYAIGLLNQNGEQTGEYIYVKEGTVWGIKEFIK